MQTTFLIEKLLSHPFILDILIDHLSHRDLIHFLNYDPLNLNLLNEKKKRLSNHENFKKFETGEVLDLMWLASKNTHEFTLLCEEMAKRLGCLEEELKGPFTLGSWTKRMIYSSYKREFTRITIIKSFYS